MNEQGALAKGHGIVMHERNKITVTGIKSVDSFDEGLISAAVSDGSVLSIEGKGLNITDLDLEKGSIEATGNSITGVFYSHGVPEKKNFFSRLVGG